MNGADLILLSHELNSETQGFGGDAALELGSKSCIADGKSCNESTLTMPLHLGTHIDLPFHFDQQGLKLHQTQPNQWIFSKPYRVQVSAKTGALLDLKTERDAIPADCDFLAVQTGWEKHRGKRAYWEENPGLAAELGFWLRANRPGVRVVALDTVSLTAYQHREEGRASHRAFLGQGVGLPIWVIEDTKLSVWPENAGGRILVSPLWIRDAEGSPVTIWWMR